MLTSTMQQALNKQINEEMTSAYVYLAIAAAADQLSLPGMVNWFKMQYQEELAHADRFINYVMERDGAVVLEAIPKPEIKGSTPLELFESALEHEQHITKCIFQLKDLAKSESDHATDVFLEWFVNEQVEEEANVREVLDQLRLIDGNKSGLFMIDRDLSTRTLEGDGK